MLTRLSLLLMAAFSLSACQTTPPPPDPAAQRGLSTIPWNRPAKWEGGGALGSQLGAMRGY